jgi:hypothetical protein
LLVQQVAQVVPGIRECRIDARCGPQCRFGFDVAGRERLGRNARFASIGNGLAAAAMGACGYLLSARAVFIVTVLLFVPALLALRAIAEDEIDPARAHGAAPRYAGSKAPIRRGALMQNRPLLIFAGCLVLFHLANSAMLPLVGSVVTMKSAHWATLIIAACIVVPQLVVAIFSPWVGRRAQIWGRRHCS